MNYLERITAALEKLPEPYYSKIAIDVDERIRDWMAGGGKETDAYIFQQVRYVENAVKILYREEGLCEV